MISSAARKGHQAELEVAALLSALTGWPVRRRLQEGRAEDLGDLEGLPHTTSQVKSYSNLARGCYEGLAALRYQQQYSGDPYGVLFLRRQGRLGTSEPRFVALMELPTFVRLLIDAEGGP